ncbi:MAG: SDR family oxidoreductase [Bacteroidia bacterium]
MQTILVTGTNGLLGQKILYQLKALPNVRLIATSKGANRTNDKSGYMYLDLDITNDKQLTEVFETYKPDTLINTAAFTNVDACELNKEACWKLNVDAVASMIELSKKYNTHFIHLSTDFVFDGTAGPYSEEDKPNPLSHYGTSKYESEKLLMQSDLQWAIIRTIIIYGVVDDNQRSNIVLWTKNSLEQQKDINVINDQYRSPTLAEDIADACVQCALRKATGIYHVSGKEQMSIWESVIIVADYFHLDKKYLHPITTASLKQPAARPLVTGFKIDKAIRELNYNPHTFLEGLKVVEAQLKEKSL